MCRPLRVRYRCLSLLILLPTFFILNPFLSCLISTCLPFCILSPSSSSALSYSSSPFLFSPPRLLDALAPPTFMIVFFLLLQYPSFFFHLSPPLLTSSISSFCSSPYCPSSSSHLFTLPLTTPHTMHITETCHK